MRLVKVTLQVGARRGAINASRVDKAHGKVSRVQERSRHIYFNAVGQRETLMSAVVDLLKGFLHPRHGRLADAWVIPNVSPVPPVKFHTGENLHDIFAN